MIVIACKKGQRGRKESGEYTEGFFNFISNALFYLTISEADMTKCYLFILGDRHIAI